MKLFYAAVVLLVQFAAASAVAAQATSQPASAPTSQPAAKVPDLLTGPIDPYIPDKERVLFFAAAGKDNKLTTEEFAADKAREKSLARKFDHWPALREHDRDGDGTINWFECAAYRQDLREKVVKEFDRNNDRRLTGPEREAANEALNSGKFPTSQPAASQPSGPRRRGRFNRWAQRQNANDPEWRQRMIEQYDTDGDGQLSDEERQAAWDQIQQREREEMLSRYDTDGDGELSPEERRAMMQDMNPRGEQDQQQRRLWVFDDDGDGELSEAESQQREEFQQRVGDMMRNFRERSMDIDGDGQVSEEEQEATRRQWRRAGLQWMMRSTRYMDTDGDGQVSFDERQAFGQRAQQRMGGWIDDFTASFDANGDGRFTPAEREGMLEGIQYELDTRYEAHDTNGDGRLDVDETIELMEEFGREAGIIPAETEG